MILDLRFAIADLSLQFVIARSVVNQCRCQ